MNQNILPDLTKAKKRTKQPHEIERFIMDLPAEYQTIGYGKTYYIHTYGCQANFHDSEIMAGILERIGFVPAESTEFADFIFLNTCAIRENAEDKVFGEIGRLKHEKDLGRDIFIGVGGCMMQQPSIIERIRTTWPEVNLIFGTHNYVELPRLIANALKETKPYIEVPSEEGKIYENLPMHREYKHKAWVSIMEGCDKFCTYCIVPFTRGKQRSRLVDDILTEVNELKHTGCKEITLLGQNVNAYGKDLDQGIAFGELLEKVADIGIDRVRFMTSHPWDFSERMIQAIHDYPNIMPYVHLPMQSGSNRILQRMGRRYTREQYFDLFQKLCECKENMAISTDVIVGFPTETEEEFLETMDLYERCQFDSAFTFAYSPRPGTVAANLEDQIPAEVKSDRLTRLIDLATKCAFDQNQKYIGRDVVIMAEGPSKTNETIWSGYTDTMRLVNFEPKENIQVGDFVTVHIEDGKSWTLKGKQV